MNRHYVALIFLAATIGSCGKQTARIEIPFVATFAGTPITCSDQAGTALSDLRFYVHDVSLMTANGEWHALMLDENEWQHAGLAMLDLEDGTGSCANGTSITRHSLQGTINAHNPVGLRFILGVPFADNHGDPLAAVAPLGEPDMHWHWRGGYKFLRAGVRSETDSFWIHLGSTGCRGTIQNITGCDASNRVSVHFDDYSAGEFVSIDLAALVAGTSLEDGLPTDCSSGPAEESCAGPFKALGLKHATGESGNAQNVFSVSRSP